MISFNAGFLSLLSLGMAAFKSAAFVPFMSAERSIGRYSFIRKSSVAVIAGSIISEIFTSPAWAVKYETEYLKEPTKEFQELEARQLAFAKQMRSYKAEWAKAETVFVDASTDASVITAIIALQALLSSHKQLPEGKQPTDVFKICRKKRAAFKSKGMWGTSVDIAYEDFIRAVNNSKKPDNSGATL